MTRRRPLTREDFENFRPHDPLTTEDIDKLAPSEQLSALQARVAPYLPKTDRPRLKEINDVSKHYSRHIGRYIQDARKDLGIAENLDFEIHASEQPDAELWLADVIPEIHGNTLSAEDYTRWLYKHVFDICSKCNLSVDVWGDYIIAYIALGKPPENAPVYEPALFIADAIDEDYITLRISRNNTKLRDFTALFSSIKQFLRRSNASRCTRR